MLLRILGSLWLLPVTLLVWVFYILPGWFFGAIAWRGWYSFLIARFVLVEHDSPYAKLWRDWSGWSGPNVMVVRSSASNRTEMHEENHCIWQMILGPFFYPAYGFHSLWLWVFCKYKHAYLDNVFEKLARKAAGQKVELGPEYWPDGPYDRWPWW